MGMAASQARFLGLTARKNNVEFEGQQINQQRTTLSNQSANYYNDLLGMAVPVPPSVDDYTKTVYTFQDGALTNQITAMMAQPNGDYTVSYLRQWTDDFSVVSANTSIVNNNNDAYMVGAKTLRLLGEINSSNSQQNTGNYIYGGSTLYKMKGSIKLDVDNTMNSNEIDAWVYNTKSDGTGDEYFMYEIDGEEAWYKVSTTTTADDVDGEEYAELIEGDIPEPETRTTTAYSASEDEYLSTLSSDQLDALKREEKEYLALLQAKYGEGDYMVRYLKNTTTGEYEPYFYKLSDLEGAIYDDNGNSQSNINCYKIGSETKIEEVKALEGCKVEKDSSGRYINITIPQYKDGEVLKDVPPVTYALTTQTSTDQGAYEDAMNQYEFDKAKYDQAIQEINAKIEIIQSEDKNLELRLKQLDTEQRAISTEIEAVGQVIQKNTESSFKTFG